MNKTYGNPYASGMARESWHVFDQFGEARPRALTSLFRFRNDRQIGLPHDRHVRTSSQTIGGKSHHDIQCDSNYTGNSSDDGASSSALCKSTSFEERRPKRAFLDHVAKLLDGPHVSAKVIVEWLNWAQLIVARYGGVNEWD